MAKIKVVTHSGSFHADDVCAVSVLMLLHKKLGNEVELVRTRDTGVMETADVVLDVGGKYDGKKFFDHHQGDGAGKRENGIPYASFGLIWKHFGEQYAGSKIVAEKFDKIFVQAVDATDNGVSIVESKFKDVFPVSLNALIMTFVPFWDEGSNKEDEHFIKAVNLLLPIIEREIAFLQKEEEAKELVRKDYEKAEDKRVVILGAGYPFQEALQPYKETMFVVFESPQNHHWHVKAVPSELESFKVRKNLPAAWGGKMNEELAKITGVEDALFCHNKRFMAVAKTKEGAVALAKLALA